MYSILSEDAKVRPWSRCMFLRAHCDVQIRAAMGKTLRFKQEDIKLKVGRRYMAAF